jgi:hypothetical protein
MQMFSRIYPYGLLDQKRANGGRGNQIIVKHNSKRQVLNIVRAGVMRNDNSFFILESIMYYHQLVVWI